MNINYKLLMILDKSSGKTMKEELKMSSGRDKSLIRKLTCLQKEEDGKQDGTNSKKKEPSFLQNQFQFNPTISLTLIVKN